MKKVPVFALPLATVIGGWALLAPPGVLRNDTEIQTEVLAAQTTPVLVELFTSEGCSSCPPADQLLRELDAQQDVPGAHVIVLSEHVDYWDHLGWRDAFSSPLWTARQQRYAALLPHGEVYTPEAVVDGKEGVIGSDRAALRGQIAAAARAEKKSLSITAAEWEGRDLVVTIAGGPYPDAVVYAVLADERDRSRVAAGENAGHALEHVAVARVLVPFEQGRTTVHIAAAGRQGGQGRVVVFAQEKGGRIIAAAERPA